MNMKRLFSGLMALILLLCCVCFALDERSEQRVFDEAQVLDADEEAYFEEYITLLRKAYAADIVLVTHENAGKLKNAAENFYKDGSFGFGPDKSGILLYCDTASGAYWLNANGGMKSIFTGNVISQLKQEGEFDLAFSIGEYALGFDDYLSRTEALLAAASEGMNLAVEAASITADGTKAKLTIDVTLVNNTASALTISDTLSSFAAGGVRGKNNFKYRSVYAGESLKGTVTFELDAGLINEELTAELICGSARITVPFAEMTDQRSVGEIAAAQATEAPAAVSKTTIDKNGSYTSKEDVAAYIRAYGKLPSNYITKSEAEALGWNSYQGNLWDVAPGKSIGGDRYGDYEDHLPGSNYTECDIDYQGGYRDSKRLVFKKIDGTWYIYYTEDHYNTFEEVK